MPSTPQEPVVVVTGASSGIGRATAIRLAGHGASVVLAARREEALREVAAQCERRGGRALVVPLDITDEDAVEDLARRAVETFGRIDVWVNNAAVSQFGRFEETPSAAFRRVLETNVFGTVHGARAAMKRFREQGRGVLINVSSVVVDLPQPYTSAYVMSKHAIRALGMSLRQELMLDDAHDIHVVTVLPATIDTPLFQHAANYTGRAVRPMPPVHPAEDVAAAIDLSINAPEDEVFVGSAGRLVELSVAVAPRLTERTMARMVEREHLEGRIPAPRTDGNLFEPTDGHGSVSGGWREQQEQAPSTSSRVLRGVAGGAAALSAFAAVSTMLFRRSRA